MFYHTLCRWSCSEYGHLFDRLQKYHFKICIYSGACEEFTFSNNACPSLFSSGPQSRCWINPFPAPLIQGSLALGRWANQTPNLTTTTAVAAQSSTEKLFVNLSTEAQRHSECSICSFRVWLEPGVFYKTTCSHSQTCVLTPLPGEEGLTLPPNSSSLCLSKSQLPQGLDRNFGWAGFGISNGWWSCGFLLGKCSSSFLQFLYQFQCDSG